MTTVRCLGCGQPTPAHRTGRCPRCRYSQPARLARKRALYGSGHQAERRMWAPIVAAGGVICPRCDEEITGPFDLGHSPGGSRPEHAHCNRAAH